MCMLICSSFLAPVFWQLWIYAGSANANFFFAITLAYSTAQVFIISRGHVVKNFFVVICVVRALGCLLGMQNLVLLLLWF